MYATAANLLDYFGDKELALLAAPESPAVDDVLLRLTVDGGDRSSYLPADISAADQALARINQVLSSASHFIDSYISPRYTLPLDAVLIAGSGLVDVCSDIARYRLMDDRDTEEVSNRYTQARAWLRDVSMNKASLGEQDTGVATAQGRITIGQGQSKTNWDTY